MAQLRAAGGVLNKTHSQGRVDVCRIQRALLPDAALPVAPSERIDLVELRLHLIVVGDAWRPDGLTCVQRQVSIVALGAQGIDGIPRKYSPYRPST